MIIKVKDKKELKQFILFVKELYKNEPNYVFPFFSMQMKELVPRVLRDASYHGLMYVEDGRILGRILYTFELDRKSGERCCYFSFFDFYERLDVAEALVNEMTRHAKSEGICRTEGPYCPYDPDTRRGVLTNQFDKLPSVFLTYNYPYYVEIYEKLGFTKVTDTVSMTVHCDEQVYKKSDRLGRMFRNDAIEISTLNRKNIKADIQAIADIMASATTEINYERAPSFDVIKSIFKEMKFFIKDEYVFIAREKGTGRAVGFIIALPELNQIFSKLGGKFNILKYLYYRKRINKVRGWLQYVIPEYQHTMLLALFFCYAGRAMSADGITEFEGGTIVEENSASFSVFRPFGGYIDKVYRIYESGVENSYS